MAYNEERFNQFIEKWKGHTGADWDGWYAGQCVDLFRYFCDEVMQIPQPAGVWGAANFWTNFESDPILKEHFTKIPNTPDFKPIKGDTMIWDFDAGGGFGHVGMVSDNEADLSFFNSFDQNWSQIDLCEIVKHNYTNVYGVLRPKKGENMSDTMTIEKKTFEVLVSKSTKYDAFVAMGYEDPVLLQKRLQELEKKTTDLQKEINDHTCPVIPPEQPSEDGTLYERHVKYQKNGKEYTDIYTI